jgi:N-acetyl-anhydromuramoyl-L-alanine amidase
MWYEGWYQFARACPSPNYSSRPQGAVVDLVVIHSISLPPGQYGGQQVQDFFCNQLDSDAHPYFETIKDLQVSAHFYVQRDGALLQFVSAQNKAWHAGVSHYRGRAHCNDDSIGIELEGLEGDVFTTRQYEALAALLPALAQQYPIQYVAGHEHIAPGRKADPGAGFDWVRLRTALAWPSTYFPLVAP